MVGSSNRSENDKYQVRCRYCTRFQSVIHLDGVFILDDDNPHQCSEIQTGGRDAWEPRFPACYSCGKIGQHYTNSQRNKNEFARCKNCVCSGNTRRYEIPAPKSIHKQLEAEINRMEPSKNKCEELLELGANPNYQYQRKVDIGGTWYDLYDGEGNEIPETGARHSQNDNYKQTCIFSMSNCMLTDTNRDELNDILLLLIRYGAIVTQDDIHLFTSRYETDDSGPFHQMYTTLIENQESNNHI